MEVQPWMLALYMLGGFCFFLFISTQVMPRYTEKRIMAALKSETGKAVMKEIILTGINSMNDPYEVEVQDAEGNVSRQQTTLGAVVMGSLAANIAKTLKLHFAGELGNFSKELKGLDGELAVQALPPALQAYAPIMMRFLKKYPVLGLLLPALQGVASLNRGAPGAPGTTNPAGSTPAFRGGC